jgi:hypothetical protein
VRGDATRFHFGNCLDLNPRASLVVGRIRVEITIIMHSIGC